MEDMKKASASTEGQENGKFSSPCGGFEKMSEMMGQSLKQEKGSFDCKSMMKKCCGNKKESFDFGKMMKMMCGRSPENPTRK
ncbi:MAG: hypothetical protein GY849_21840 [Deltaproteobacteria bacterium]|nr:hypothetical protein [Deltaproteobacteria bacterium]